MNDQYYMYQIRPTRVNFSATASESELAIMEDHFLRLKQMLTEGQLLLAGPCEDEAFGIVIFTAASSAEAEEIMRSDPAVKEGLMTCELHPFRVSLLKNTEPRND